MEQNMCRVGEDTSDTGVYLPEELIISILKRLPVKSLLRFISVCQSWYSLIKNPDFISTHVSHQIAIYQNCISNHSEPPGFLLYAVKPYVCERCLVHSDNDSCDRTQAPVSERCYVYSDNDSFDRTQELMLPEFPPEFVLERAGMCKGIVYLGQTQGVNAVIWNPSLRKHLHLDIPHTVRLSKLSFGFLAPGSSSVYAICGIGFDLLSNDYKFVSIAISSDPRHKMEAQISSVCVYSLNQGAWKHVISDFVIRANCTQSYGEYLNGVIHWLVQDSSKVPGVLVSILTFNLADETFGEIPLPECLDYAQIRCYYAEVMTVPAAGKKIAFLYLDDTQRTVNLWIMEIYGVKESWRLAASFKEEREDGYDCSSIITVRKNGEFLVNLEGVCLGSLNLRDMSMKVLTNTRMWYFGPYMETLALL